MNAIQIQMLTATSFRFELPVRFIAGTVIVFAIVFVIALLVLIKRSDSPSWLKTAMVILVVFPAVALTIFVGYVYFYGVLLRDTDVLPFERALMKEFDGSTLPGSTNRFTVECRQFDCSEVLSKLPPMTRATCRYSLIPNGACCSAAFGDSVRGVELHIWWKGSERYSLSMLPPNCVNPDYDPPPDGGEADDPQWVPCDELSEWGKTVDPGHRARGSTGGV
jgi:hypothetical protein